ncbi:ABC transporter permease [Scleromatobacter humisilvae]|uniref:ABC transporter permease n=1 Tax=Scleromatobacter humisilvae TaxID=2897159 RepID=A0A9X1YLB6_9BURK|nr:ABC transporter permease [Scleromatobacter humisilvae]MCK9686482.1 ABC transporter permease [Scleromatobacter humisilvae]
MPKFVLLWTDSTVWALVAFTIAYAAMVARSPNLKASWRKVFRDAPALCSSLILALCLVITMADSVHYRPALKPAAGAPAGSVAYDTVTKSGLDFVLSDLVASREVTYSRPLAYVSYRRDTVTINGQPQRVSPRLLHGGAQLSDPEHQWGSDLLSRGFTGLVLGLALAAAAALALFALLARARDAGFLDTAASVWRNEGEIPWRAALWTLVVIATLSGVAISLMGAYHVFGTDTTGNDVLYQALKSIRTAFVIGALSTIATLPLAVVLGIMAGYFRGWVDEVIQYFYTVLSSVPNILLIAACVLMVQVYLDKHPDMFETGVERADVKLFLLCTVLGLTGWAGLCRLLRAETMKLRELDYVQAASAFGVGPMRIMVRHIFPNVAHLMLIVTVLDFSSLILYEAVLSYVGVGVDPSMNSFGGMINLARKEMSLDPVVWWSFAAAFGFMVTVVLAVNLFADGVRDAFDPRARAFRPRLAITRRPAAKRAQA